MGSFGGLEWLVIGLAVLLLFGAKRIPELARGIGQGINEFQRAKNDIRSEIETSQNEIREAAKYEPAKEEPAATAASETRAESA